MNPSTSPFSSSIQVNSWRENNTTGPSRLTDLRVEVGLTSTAGLLAVPVRERHSAPAAGPHTPEQASVGGEAAVRQTEAGQSGDSPHHLLTPGRVVHEAQPDGPLVQDTVPAVLLQADIDHHLIEAGMAPLGG